MKIYLSNSDYLRNFDSFLRLLDTTDPDRLEITTHDKWISVHPVVLAIAASLGLTVKPENISIDDVVARSGHYLERMGLFRMLGLDSPFTIEEREPAGRFIPLTLIKTQQEQSRFITEMIPMLHLPPEQADAIKYVVGELVRNVLEHSNASNGAVVVAQYYARSNVIRLGICDTGIGIKHSITRSWPAATDLDAIKLALTPGITGTTTREGGTDVNAGAGLFFIKSMSVVARDYFVLYSGQGIYRLLKRRPSKRFPKLKASPDDDVHAESSTAPHFPGTVVGIDIGLNQTSEFKDLLAVIRKTYTHAIKERRAARYKKPRFI